MLSRTLLPVNALYLFTIPTPHTVETSTIDAEPRTVQKQLAVLHMNKQGLIPALPRVLN